MMPVPLGYSYPTRRNEVVGITTAVALHALLLLLNPILLKGGFEKPKDPLIEIGMVVEGAPAPPVEAPKKMSILDTLKDMLSRPEPAAPKIEAPAPRVAPPAGPTLRERLSPSIIANPLKPQTPEELASARSAAPINVSKKEFQLPNTTPALQSKSFGGVRAKDLPFQVGNETIAAGTPTEAISVGNRSAKAALSYANPTLKDAGARSTLSNKNFVGGGTADPASLGAASTPIQLAGSGASQAAPSNAAPALAQRQGGGSGGGLVQRALSGAPSASSAIQSMPSAAAKLEQDLAADSANASRMKKPKGGFEISGKLANRQIVRKVIPQYPSWAEEQGIIGTLRLYFTVTPEGLVRQNIKVTKTTGNPQLDQIGIDALKQWQFAAQPSGNEDDLQWGIITFTFSLAS